MFKSIGLHGTSTSLLTTGIFGVVKTICTLVWLFFLIDKLGRRNLLMIGGAGGSVCMWIIGAYVRNPFLPFDGTCTDLAQIYKADVTNNTGNTQVSGGGVAAIFFFYLWTAFYTPSWNGVRISILFCMSIQMLTIHADSLGHQQRDVRQQQSILGSGVSCCRQLVLGKHCPVRIHLSFTC